MQQDVTGIDLVIRTQASRQYWLSSADLTMQGGPSATLESQIRTANCQQWRTIAVMQHETLFEIPDDR